MLNQIKLGPKLIGGFLIVSIIAGVIGIFGIMNIKTIDNADTFLYEKVTVPIGDLNMMTTYFLWEWADINAMLHTDSIDEIKELEEKIKEFRKEFKKYAEDYTKTFINKDDEKNYNKYMDAYAKYMVVADKVIELLKSGNKAEADILVAKEGNKEAKSVDDINTEIASLNIKTGEDTADNNTKIANFSSLFMITLTIIGFLLSLILGIILSRSITKPILYVTEGSGKFAKGDNELTGMDTKYLTKLMARKDELGLISSSFSELMHYFNEKVNIAKEVSIGNLDVESKLSSDLDNLGKAFQLMIGSLKEKSVIANEIAKGNLIVEAKILSDKDSLGKAYQQMIKSLKDLLSQINTVSEQVLAGSEQV
ncbi:MAG TPA: MCP four helix bundle domain-containing protein, partial [Spirochaetota bacterium]|nr:MCP four helix bundle domain-containing protein [Spirochaetota bacterium]